MWWDFHRLMDLTPEELVDEDDPIGGLEPIGPLGEPKNGKQIWRYRFPPQEYDLGRGRGCTSRAGSRRDRTQAVQLGGRRARRGRRAAGTVDLRRDADEPHPHALVPLRLGPHRRSTRRRSCELGEWVADHGIDADGPYRGGPRPAPAATAARRPGGRRRRCAAGETDLDAARRLALALDRPRCRSRVRPGRARRTPARG